MIKVFLEIPDEFIDDFNKEMIDKERTFRCLIWQILKTMTT